MVMFVLELGSKPSCISATLSVNLPGKQLFLSKKVFL